jgi:hypothetical protein
LVGRCIGRGLSLGFGFGWRFRFGFGWRFRFGRRLLVRDGGGFLRR